MPISDSFEKYFRAISYLVAISGLFALFVAGGIGVPLFSIFILVSLLAWKIENTKWQLSERLGLAIVLVAIPLFIIDWRFRFTGLSSSAILAAGSLAKLILFLMALKLLQRKSDRDWIFIYLISFFQILLAAGISISPLYLVALISYLLLTTCAIIAFEMRKTSREMKAKHKENLGPGRELPEARPLRIRRLPVTAIVLLVAITVFAVPLFFTLPRVGGAGLGGNEAGSTRITGFSDTVELGAIGRLQQNDATVMRVRIDRNDNPRLSKILWRGVALDKFDKKTWSKTFGRFREPFAKQGRDRFVVDFARRDGKLTVHTVYMEPLNTSILFGLSRPVLIQSNADQLVKDAEGAISSFPVTYERTSYTVYSDTFLPEPDLLRLDRQAYAAPAARYLDIPLGMDVRIGELAASVVDQANATNRYDKARAIERHLQNGYGYTLDLKAGGEEPLADFLFSVREGHCEYFSTAMAMMLRTQGIASRVVNGFQRGDYNETADVYVVKQRNAHSWVEVYFPEERVWVPFDPTPFAGQYSEAGSSTVLGMISGYLEALETFWIQYFVSYDNQEQRSLFRSFRDGFAEYKAIGAIWAGAIQDEITKWWQDVRGDRGLQASLLAVAYAAGYVLGGLVVLGLVYFLFRRLRKLSIWKRLASWWRPAGDNTVVEFYERLLKLMGERGMERESHQTPLEFAYASGFDEAVKITEKYNAVRFGEKKLRKDETDDIESWLNELGSTKEEEQ